MNHITKRAFGCVAVLVLSASATVALSSPADAALVGGPIFRANVTTEGSQTRPAVAFAGDGTSVIAWVSGRSPGSDSSGTSVLARRFAADGTPLGAEFQVNTSTAGDQNDPAVAFNASGAFVIAWTSADGALIPHTDPACDSAQTASGATVDCYNTGVRGQLYTSAGVPDGPELLINGGPGGGTLDYQHSPDVALADDGTLVAVWNTELPTFDGSGRAIAGRHGSKFFRVNTSHQGWQYDPAVAVNASGAFAVAWTSEDGLGVSTSNPACGTGPYAIGATIDCYSVGVRGQLYTSAGEPDGSEMLLNGGPAGGTLAGQVQPDVALADDGTLLATWVTAWADFDGSGRAIAGRHGSTFFRANTTTTGIEYDPTVSVNASGAFAIAWVSENEARVASSDPTCGGEPYGTGATVDCYASGIRGQLYTSAGVPDGTEMLLNGGPAGGTLGFQLDPAAALADDGTLLATWTNYWAPFEGSLGAIAGRYFRTVQPQPPVASPDVVTTDEDSPLSVDVRTNDSDADGSSAALDVQITAAPGHGTATVEVDQRVTYTPDPNYHGPDSLTYQVTDASGLSSTAQVMVTVTAINDAPTAAADSFTVPASGGSLAVLTNDGDIDGDTLAPVIVAGPSGGSAAVQPDGTVAYTPAAGTAADTFTYRAHDGQLESSIVAVTVAVLASGPELSASIQQPIDAVGDPSTFNAKRGVIPIRWQLTADGAPTCALPAATIHLARVAGTAIGPVDEGTYAGASDSGAAYRVTDCQYLYNLDAKRVGPGSYHVSIVIDGITEGTAAFELR